MAPIVTASAMIMCSHGGTVTLRPGQTQVLIQGGPVLCEPDLIGAPIVGCMQPPTLSTKPCTSVVATNPGSSSPVVIVAGRPAYVASLSGITDGVPPGTISVLNAGQTVAGG